VGSPEKVASTLECSVKILCICPVGLGNYLMTYPAYSSLAEVVPGAELHLLALRGSIAAMAKGDPLWKKIHVIDPTQEKSAARRIAFLRDLSAEKLDASLSFFPSNNWQYNLLPFVCRIPRRVALSYRLKRTASLAFLNTSTLELDPEAHDIVQNLRLVSLFSGSDVSSKPLRFPKIVTESAALEAVRFLEELGGRKLYIGIHPGSSAEHGMASKRWDPSRFGALATRICDAIGAQALIFGSGDEDPIKRLVASEMKAPHRIVPPTSLPVTAALVERCTLMLANDSGLMHLAACQGVPTIAVFGPTDERRNGPAGDGHLVVRKEMEGFPLWTAANVGVRAVKKGIDPMASLKALSVDDAWGKVKAWLPSLRPAVPLLQVSEPLS
jgi:heptosyltransferase-2